jgi:uncharacterized protein (DUF1330 family)
MHRIHFQHSAERPYTPSPRTQKDANPMSAYLIVDVTRIRDEDTYGRYKKLVSPGMVEAGGRYLARGGTIDVLEGDWRPHRLILVRFESAAAARTWWASKEYAPLKGARQASTDCNMVIVDGVPETESP